MYVCATLIHEYTHTHTPIHNNTYFQRFPGFLHLSHENLAACAACFGSTYLGICSCHILHHTRARRTHIMKCFLGFWFGRLDFQILIARQNLDRSCGANVQPCDCPNGKAGQEKRKGKARKKKED